MHMLRVQRCGVRGSFHVVHRALLDLTHLFNFIALSIHQAELEPAIAGIVGSVKHEEFVVVAEEVANLVYVIEVRMVLRKVLENYVVIRGVTGIQPIMNQP